MSVNVKPLLKVIILGDSGVGKTSIINQYVNRKFTISYRKTIGADFCTKELFVNDTVVTLQIWDTVGQERFQSLGIAFYRGADCVILVYDVTSPESYQSLKIWKDEFEIQGSPNNPKQFPFVVLGNKTDLGNKICEENIEDILNCDYKVPHYKTSAKNNINVDGAFSIAAKMALERNRQEVSWNSIPNIMEYPQNNRRHSNCHC